MRQNPSLHGVYSKQINEMISDCCAGKTLTSPVGLGGAGLVGVQGGVSGRWFRKDSKEVMCGIDEKEGVSSQ